MLEVSKYKKKQNIQEYGQMKILRSENKLMNETEK